MKLSGRILALVGTILVAFGIFIAGINSFVLDYVIYGNLVLAPDSASYPMWKDLPLPLTNKIYIFNVTNANDVAKHGAKPQLDEVGPYVFEEYHHKFDEIWNKNGTVTYKQENKWLPISNNLDEKVTIVNVPFATLGAMVEHLPSITKSLINLGLKFLKKEDLFVTKTVREILFEGYPDPMLEAAKVLEDFGIKMPGLTSKFGFFYGRNDTWYNQGITNLYTGSKGLGLLGRIASWNYSTHSPFYPGNCGKYSGSPDLTPPYLDGNRKQYIFNNDLGRTL